MKYKRCTAQQAVALLRDYYDKWGGKQMDISFGWKHVPEQLVPGERFYRVSVDDAVVGWGSMVLNTRDATDEQAMLSAGVFPEQQRKGYHRAITEWMCQRAKKLGAVYAVRIVYKENEAHYLRTKKLCQDPASGWVYAGDIWYPGTGYGKFMKPLKDEA